MIGLFFSAVCVIGKEALAMSASSGNKLTDDADIAKQEAKFVKNLPMSASSLNKCDSAKQILIF
jgi:hypothetical protein